jgi:hypothetical protein
MDWTAAVNSEAAEWCTVSPLTGSGNGAVIVNGAENTAFESHAATVTISAGTLTQEVGVTQVGIAPALMTDKSAIDAPHATSYHAIAVTSNTGWTAAVNDEAAEWCIVSPASGTGNGSILVTVAENPIAVPRAATINFKAGTLTCATTVEQEPADPTLTVDRILISASLPAGSYPITVTSNANWIATVDSEAEAWCTVSPASGLGSDVVMVNVMESTAPRAATVTISAGTLARTIPVMQQPTPPYAASAKVWTFGEQTWSDAIHITPECNKPNFTSSTITPSCRSYTSGTFTGYYYNWPYVDANKEIMCPDPWRVPTSQEFVTLTSNVTHTDLIERWGYSGYAQGSNNITDLSTVTYYWSSTVNIVYASMMYCLNYGSSYLSVYSREKYYGLQVRCVK